MSFWNSIVKILLSVLMLIMGILGVLNLLFSVWGMAILPDNMLQLGLSVSSAMIWALVALYAVTGRKRKKNARFLYFNNEGGTVSVSTDAIADYVSKLLAEFPSIVQMKPKIIPARNAINVLIKVKIKADSQISEVCELLQHRVRESIGTGLGIQQVGEVEVSVVEIISEHVRG
jgi:uncharacterized alkaline shock family protein YloU